MNAEILSIGDELLIGQVTNSNASVIAEQLNTVGIFADTMTTVGDDEQAILGAFDRAYRTHDVITVTGGLGPTHDDITRAAVCKFFKTNLIRNDEALENIKRIFTIKVGNCAGGSSFYNDRSSRNWFTFFGGY